MKVIEGKSEFVPNTTAILPPGPVVSSTRLSDKERAFIKTLSPKAFMAGSVQRQMCELLISLAEREAQ